MKVLALVALATVALGGVASAGDGRIEINQTCVARPCVFGDPIGFPIFLPAGGNFVLTSDLIVPDPATTAIGLGDYATLDLNGFAIRGPATCTVGFGSATVVSCTNAGTGDGIIAGAHSTIRNGTVRGMGDTGILVGQGMLIADMLIEENAGDGIKRSSGSDGVLIRDSRINRNGDRGVALVTASADAEGALLLRISVEGNKGTGISVGGSLVLESMVSRNGGAGLLASGLAKTGYGSSVLIANNGGDGDNGGPLNPQVVGTNALRVGTSLCGLVACP